MKSSQRRSVIAALSMDGGRCFHDSASRRIGSATTDSKGTVTNYDSRGRVISREITTGNVTTIYDARGRTIRRFTAPNR